MRNNMPLCYIGRHLVDAALFPGFSLLFAPKKKRGDWGQDQVSQQVDIINKNLLIVNI